MDGLGSVTALVEDASGVVEERYQYDSFGQPTILAPDGTPRTCSAFGNPFLFTGREYDCESGLYYYRARYYDPRTGRFLQEDPLGLMGAINLYRYALNNPVNRVDPFGLLSIMRPVGVQIIADPAPDTPHEGAIVDVVQEQGPSVLVDPAPDERPGQVIADPPTPVGVSILCEGESKSREIIKRPGGTTEIETRGRQGVDGGQSRVIRMRDKSGRTTGVWHEVRDRQGRVIHRDWKGPQGVPAPKGFREVQ
ncbi:MAG TPA: hypothetical protein DD714_00595 [Candidatus Omnitrophica bacterium]|nr:hypothetical protein [Candidatus Omnitrophota bacterium]